MTTGIIRTFLIYILLVLIMRMTGKRQIGELEICELVSTILISEIAASPISNHEVPLTFAIVPILLIISLEISISFLSTRSSIMKKIFLGSPSVLICRGKLQQKELSKARMSLEELLCQIREKGYPTIEDVNYAIIESDGTFSIIPKANVQNVTPKDLSVKVQESGMAHAVIVDGVIKKEALCSSGKSRAWIENELHKAKADLKEVFLMTVDDANHVYIIKKES